MHYPLVLPDWLFCSSHTDWELSSQVYEMGFCRHSYPDVYGFLQKCVNYRKGQPIREDVQIPGRTGAETFLLSKFKTNQLDASNTLFLWRHKGNSPLYK